MSDATFDPNAVTAAYLSAIAPARKAGQEGFKSVERFARLQYAVVGDCLESGLAQRGAAFTAKTPTDLMASQSTLTQQLAEKLRARLQEFVELTTEIQGAFKQAAAAAVATAVPLKKAS